MAPALRSSFRTDELPRPLREALVLRHPLMVNDLETEGGGVAPDMRSGLYGALPAREATVGLIILEHRTPTDFALRDLELLSGFVEPAALAIDNARWFARLRTVGADEERTRIARDLHDRIGQSLAYLAFELDRIVKADARGRAGRPRSSSTCARTCAASSGRCATRSTTCAPTSPTLETSRHPRGVPRPGHPRPQRARDPVDLDETARLPLLQERELWRIAQEAITNVERHATATSVDVTWHCDGGERCCSRSTTASGSPISAPAASTATASWACASGPPASAPPSTSPPWRRHHRAVRGPPT
jgi:hypothetical protein